MDVILDESTLAPCGSWNPARRILALASTISALDELGCARVLRSVRTAADQDIGQGCGLRRWCFDPGTNRDAGILIAQRLGKQPFIDGAEGLFAMVEGARAIEGHLGNVSVIGLAFAALTNQPAVALGSANFHNSTELAIDLATLDGDDEFWETIQVCRLVTKEDACQRSESITRGIEDSVANGKQLIERASDLFPQLRFGPRALQQITGLTGNEPVFHQLFRHLRALDQGVSSWQPDTQYSPASAISWSRESNATLQHASHGPLRDFPMPQGFTSRRWSDHTKPSGGNGARLYFHAERAGDEALVLIGYFGEHLPTVRF
ncbi:hypothetical protein [Gallionella capsiferriformans]|uniref:Uncharacterized protein n=1 Tax=Gallionella capsiferriformans (strain ES-2) TaxID=395494 RepID=D9SGA9_GALCS|nr:hypothetical protein [Gallionella capsiferriformans]ADL55556.1 hypothetical protein Galf_1537 [Gallionella capsiferriformans ES-2]